MGSATLLEEKKPIIAMTNVFSGCITMSESLLARIQTLESDNQRLTQERQNALDVSMVSVLDNMIVEK